MASTVKNLIEISGLADSFPTNPMTFKQFTVQETLELPEAKPDIEQIVKVVAQVIITSTRVIRTPLAESLEGQRLSGVKLIIEGEVVQKIEYVADVCTQSVHAAHFNVPFSTFIVLPTGFGIGTPLIVTPYIEDIYVDLIDKRTIFKNVTIFLDATF
jgi:hypothetical protein